MLEIQALQSRQKEEIEALYTRMGKPPPPNVFSPAVAMAGGRRRIKSKSHKSARSSGQPSPSHLGMDSQWSILYLEPLPFDFYHYNIQTCSNVYTLQEPQPPAKTFTVQSQFQSKTLCLQQRL